jgi:20S proteasome alpha/beta subunit
MPPARPNHPAWEAIGCGSDVALHYVRSCRPIVDFDTEKLSALVYFSISEIAKSDVRVGKPIDIAVVNEGGATIKQRESIQHLEPVSEHLGSVIRNEILAG